MKRHLVVTSLGVHTPLNDYELFCLDIHIVNFTELLNIELRLLLLFLSNDKFCESKLIFLYKNHLYSHFSIINLSIKTVLILGISKSGGDPPPLHKMWGRG